MYDIEGWTKAEVKERMAWGRKQHDILLVPPCNQFIAEYLRANCVNPTEALFFE